MRLFAAAVTITALFATAAIAQDRPARPAPTPATGEVTQIPRDLAPGRIQSAALTVSDLPAMQKWYETALGMVKVRDVGANEIVLSMDPTNPNASNVVLQRGRREDGATSYGRLILNVKNAKATAEFLQSHGVTTYAVIPDQAYFLNDPEGNRIELYQPK